MKRRDIVIGLGAAAAAWQAGPAVAAGEPTEGKEYLRLQPPMPVAVAGKIEVLEFFGYWCPHCNALEPSLEAWQQKLPAEVNFRRSPVGWQAMHEPYQKLYFALESLGLGAGIHGKVFNALHRQGLRFDNDAGLTAFASANGIDKAKLLDAMKGFTVASRVRQANQLWASSHLDSVPRLVVQGRWATGPDLAGGDAAALKVVDALILKAKTSS